MRWEQHNDDTFLGIDLDKQTKKKMACHSIVSYCIILFVCFNIELFCTLYSHFHKFDGTCKTKKQQLKITVASVSFITECIAPAFVMFSCLFMASAIWIWIKGIDCLQPRWSTKWNRKQEEKNINKQQQCFNISTLMIALYPELVSKQRLSVIVIKKFVFNHPFEVQCHFFPFSFFVSLSL